MTSKLSIRIPAGRGFSLATLQKTWVQNKLTKISSQPVFQRYKARKASYLGYLKSSQNQISKVKPKKQTSVNNQKIISKLSKASKQREHSSSAQSFYTEKQPINKLGKSKNSVGPKFTSRNSENPAPTEFSIVNTGSFNNHLITFKRQRPSVDVVKKAISSTINNDLITPRNKLIPKVSLLKKAPSESNERGQSSNYRRVRIGRIGTRKESDTAEEAKFESRVLETVSLSRSISIQSTKCNEGFHPSFKNVSKEVLKENTGLANTSHLAALNKSNVIHENIIKSKLRIEREDSKQLKENLRTEVEQRSDSDKWNDENMNCTEESSQV